MLYPYQKVKWNILWKKNEPLLGFQNIFSMHMVIYSAQTQKHAKISLRCMLLHAPLFGNLFMPDRIPVSSIETVSTYYSTCSNV